jgi:magnesium-protoporphyrin O-methyltransferase
MSCCQCQGIETCYNRKSVAKNLRKYRLGGPGKTTRILIDALKVEDVKGAILLDIGGGVGAIQHELLKAGAGRAINVEASTAFIEAAKEEAERQGHADRVSHYHGNFVDLASDIPQADIVTLDKVICCYHDMQALVGLSSSLARRFYGVVYPQDSWRAKFGFAAENFVYWIRRSSFRVFVHPTKAVDAVIRQNGLHEIFYQKIGVWQIVVYVRPNISESRLKTANRKKIM